MDTGGWLDLLLQHFHRLCRGAYLYVCEGKAHTYTCLKDIADKCRHHALPSRDITRDRDLPYSRLDSRQETRASQVASASTFRHSFERLRRHKEDQPVAPGGPEDLEAEAGQQGAFNEETGEINWDCPCLGGMAHGPCGEQFREAFSCFVFSKDEPKGIDCIDKFKGMQDCFREHPDVYGAELEDDEAPQDGAEAPVEGQAVPEGAEKVSKPQGRDSDEVVAGKQERSSQAAQQVKQTEALSESDELVPKAWHSGVDANMSK